MRRVLHLGSLLAPVLCLAAAATTAAFIGGSIGVHAQDDASQPAFYTEKVLPVLQQNCYRCHAGMNHRGGFNMSTRETMLKGGHDGPAVVPGHPEQGWMVRLIRREGPPDNPMPMPPPPRHKLSDADITIIEAWIKAGAVTPTEAGATSQPSR